MKPFQGLVSVVIPAFNATATINEAIASVLAQTYTNLEVIVCNDASTDDTADIVETISDNRVQLLRNSRNLGEGLSRDRAIAAARGQWIAVLDADDAWHSQRLERLIAAIGDDSQIMVFDDIIECHHTPQGLVPWRHLYGKGAFGAKSKPSVDVPAADWITRKRTLIKPLIPTDALRRLGETHTTRRFAADLEFFLKLIGKGMNLRFIPEAYYYYRITPGAMSAHPTRYQLLEEALEQTAPLFSHDVRMLEALHLKIKQVQRYQDYRRFLDALKNRRYFEAIRRAREHPFVIRELATRTYDDAPYRFHRWLHHGTGRY
jgi:succinoglycan biosynthesis protein ExoO